MWNLIEKINKNWIWMYPLYYHIKFEYMNTYIHIDVKADMDVEYICFLLIVCQKQLICKRENEEGRRRRTRYHCCQRWLRVAL